jgi:hypothetical protein
MFIKEASYYRQVVLKIPGIPGGNQGTVFTFDDQPDIRNARTVALEVYFASALDMSQPAKIPVIPDVYAPRITLRFETNDPDDPTFTKGKPQVQGSRETTGFTGTLNTVQWIPASRLNVMQGVATPSGLVPAPWSWPNIMWKDRYIVWQKSDVWISGQGLGNTTDLALVVGVYYSFLTVDGKPIVR